MALMWIGRGDMEPEEWDEALALAADRHENGTAAYLLSHPHFADHLDEGLDRLLDGSEPDGDRRILTRRVRSRARGSRRAW